VDLPSALASHLRDLVESVGAGDDTVVDSLDGLTGHLRTAVSSYHGLRLTLVLDEWPVTLTAFSVIDGERPVTSLRLNLSSQGSGFDPDSQVVLYAGTPGAFVDLAADIDYLYRERPSVDGDGHRPPVALDIDLPPFTLVSGFAGLTEYATINRAVGLLIGRGQDPAHARDTLHREAATNGLALHQYAARLVNQ
jgi:hypothetical protein